MSAEASSIRTTRTSVDVDFHTRWATASDADRIVELLPRLADYDLPQGRIAEDFWLGDVGLVKAWAQSEVPDAVVRVAVDKADQAVAVAIVTYKPDHFNGKPNAHLETIVVHPDADGAGVGRKLIAEMQHEAVKRGALSMSLHVVANNHRARHVYQKLGFGEEMIRAIKFLSPPDATNQSPTLLHYRTVAELEAAKQALIDTMPGLELPLGYAVGHARPGGSLSFPVVNQNGEHHFPAIALANVLGYRSGSRSFVMSRDELEAAIAVLKPAEACAAYEHPNLWAWEQILADIDSASLPGDTEVHAVFIGREADPVGDGPNRELRRLLEH